LNLKVRLLEAQVRREEEAAKANFETARREKALADIEEVALQRGRASLARDQDAYDLEKKAIETKIAVDEAIADKEKSISMYYQEKTNQLRMTQIVQYIDSPNMPQLLPENLPENQPKNLPQKKKKKQKKKKNLPQKLPQYLPQIQIDTNVSTGALPTEGLVNPKVGAQKKATFYKIKFTFFPKHPRSLVLWCFFSCFLKQLL
jgi:hypothetical protein